jgi:hypothetical protein
MRGHGRMNNGLSAGSRQQKVAEGSPAERLARACIIGVGVLSLVLLAWDGLGLGAWLLPPAPSPTQRVLTAGPYRLAFRADSGQLTTGGPNIASVVVLANDGTGQIEPGTTISLQAEMAAMAMAAPRVPMSVEDPRQPARYVAHPRFSMAGIWRLNLTISATGQPVQRATMTVSVRWGDARSARHAEGL